MDWLSLPASCLSFWEPTREQPRLRVCEKFQVSQGTGWWAAGPALAAPDQEGALGPLDEHLGPWSANKGLQWEGGDLVCGFCSPWVPGLLH